mmetsp:Transcript_10527/g.64590  ORF Transcript_10527/g.64590 Transcript_10527/m.64590 type:complete len:397 (+) Transcript_10527:1910-3100(+)
MGIAMHRASREHHFAVCICKQARHVPFFDSICFHGGSIIDPPAFHIFHDDDPGGRQVVQDLRYVYALGSFHDSMQRFGICLFFSEVQLLLARLSEIVEQPLEVEFGQHASRHGVDGFQQEQIGHELFFDLGILHLDGHASSVHQLRFVHLGDACGGDRRLFDLLEGTLEGWFPHVLFQHVLHGSVRFRNGFVLHLLQLLPIHVWKSHVAPGGHELCDLRVQATVLLGQLQQTVGLPDVHVGVRRTPHVPAARASACFRLLPRPAVVACRLIGDAHRPTRAPLPSVGISHGHADSRRGAARQSHLRHAPSPRPSAARRPFLRHRHRRGAPARRLLRHVVANGSPGHAHGTWCRGAMDDGGQAKQRTWTCVAFVQKPAKPGRWRNEEKQGEGCDETRA